MLQIRLSKGGPASDGGGGAAKPPTPSDAVTVACPDHLVIADLSVAKGLGPVPPSSASVAVKSVGRRSRRHLGERVHFCVCCDFPIAVYGRLVPCEHAFCLTCARSDSSCYLCDERIQKIQTIKLMEGIIICAAPHCLKSFLKRSEFETHIQEIHSDLLQSNVDKEVANETDTVNMTRPSSTDTIAKQSAQPESSTARAPSRPGFSPSSNSQLQDRDDRSRRNQSREQTPMRPPPQLMPIPFHGRQQQQTAESQPDNNAPPQGNWYQQPHGFDNQSASQHWRDSDQLMSDKPTGVPPESPFPDYQSSHPFQIPNFPVPMMFNQGINLPPGFMYPPFPTDGSQQFYNAPLEMPRPEMVPEPGQEQGSVLGFSHIPTGTTIPGNYPQQWNNAIFINPQFQSVALGQGNPQGHANPMDDHGRAPFFQGQYDRASELVKDSDLPAGSTNHSDGKGVLAPLPVPMHMPISLPPPPPPPLPPPSTVQQQNRGKFSGPD